MPLLPTSVPPGVSELERVEGDSILIRNVQLIEEQAQVAVSVVVRDGILDLVSEDEVSVRDVPQVYDGEGGFVLGQLEIGAPATFLVLAEDPRTNFRALMDTRFFTRFAIEAGVVVNNALPRVLALDEQPNRGWLAYTPPPVALPTSYRDVTKWNRWESEFISGIFLAALVIDRQNWVSQDSTSTGQVGDLDAFDGGEVRGLRFGVTGTLNFETPWVYTVFAATHAFDEGFDVDTTDELTFFDWRLDIPTYADTTLSLGKQKEPISMERTMALVHLPLQERSAASDALLPARNIGAVVSGGAFEDGATWAAGFFNDWIESSDSFSDSAAQAVGRVTWVPYATADDAGLAHLGLGVRYTDAVEGLAYRATPEFNQSPDFVDTGRLDAEGGLTYDLEASLRWGPVWLSGEYIANELDASELEDPRLDGYHVTAAWALTGEMRPYSRRNGTFLPLPIAKSVLEGGGGAWELAARYSELDASDGLVDGGELEIASAGITWWLTPVFAASFNYRWVTLDRFGDEGHSEGFVARVYLALE